MITHTVINSQEVHFSQEARSRSHPAMSGAVEGCKCANAQAYAVFLLLISQKDTENMPSHVPVPSWH